jgi:hypothetical protein
MKLWDNIFAVSYNYIGRLKNQDQRSGAVSIVATSIMTLLFMLAIILGKVLKQNLIKTALPIKLYVIPVVFLIFYLVNLYYSTSRAAVIMPKFNAFSTTKREIWKFITVIFYVGPLIVIAFLLKK